MASIQLDPAHARLDEPVRLTLTGLPPRSQVTIRLRAVTLRAEASAAFVADDTGTVHVTEPMRLFTEAVFDEGADVLSMVEHLASLAPLEYRLDAEVDGAAAASHVFERETLAPGVARTEVRGGRVRGALFAPSGANAAPAVVVLGGSDGGNTFQYVAALLAAQGFAALSLPYFAYEDLPTDLVEIPLEYFEEALAWLRERPEVDGGRVGVLGMSYGGQLALLLGATVAGIGAVVALVPSGITGGAVTGDFSRMARAAWTHRGQPLPFIPPRYDPDGLKQFAAAAASGRPIAMTPGFLRLLEGAALEAVTIPVERTTGSILLMSAGDDQVWPSTVLAEIALARLRANAFPYPVEYLTYPEAGHFACLPPYIPTTMTWSRHPLTPFAMELGGSPHANAEAAADLWPRIVAFLARSLAPRVLD
jgi:dienelactone hydrolase